jgi:tRNA A37 threonylcarbamoyladenosine synthetase subunit TsaC/SUA5/YrdC
MISFFKKNNVIDNNMEIASVWNISTMQRAAAYIAKGQAVGIFMGTVCVLFGKGDDNSFFNEVVRVKGEKRRTKPLGLIMTSDEVIKLIDPSKIPASLHSIFLNPTELTNRFGAICFLRLPVRKEVVRTMPAHHFSYEADGTPVIMILDPAGFSTVQFLKEAVHNKGVKYFTGTSMNYSGQPELVKQADGIEFCREVGNIPLFMTDPTNSGKIQGSLPIIKVGPTGPELLRQGFIPLAALEKLVGTSLDTSSLRLASYPLMELSSAEVVDLPTYALRQVILKKLAS